MSRSQITHVYCDRCKKEILDSTARTLKIQTLKGERVLLTHTVDLCGACECETPPIILEVLGSNLPWEKIRDLLRDKETPDEATK